jgi:hypothetical protein
MILNAEQLLKLQQTKDGVPEDWTLYPMVLREDFDKAGISYRTSKYYPDSVWAPPEVKRAHDMFLDAGAAWGDLSFPEFLVRMFGKSDD